MRRRWIAIPLAIAFCWCGGWAFAATTVAVYKVDDAEVTGNLIGAGHGNVILETKPDKSPTTRLTIPLDDVSRVVVHEHATAPAAAPAVAPAAGALQKAFSWVFGNNSSNSNDSDDSSSSPAPSPPPASRPVGPLDCSIRLVDNDIFHGQLTAWTDQILTFTDSELPGQKIQLPVNQVRQLWCANPDAIKKARSLMKNSSQTDTAFVQSGNSVVAVQGAAQGIAGDALQFQYGDTERKIALARLVGITIASHDPANADNAFRQAFRLDSGDIFSGTWVGATDASAQLQTPWGQSFSIPLSRIDTIESVHGRLVYLSDLTPGTVEQTPFFGRVVPFQFDRSLDGAPIQLSDGQYSKGIAMHARCILTFDIGGMYTNFRAKLGFEHPRGDLGQSIVRVLGDGRVLLDDPDARGDEPPRDLSIDVTGVRQLSLMVDFGKSQDVGARVVWANARLLRPKASNRATQ